MIPCWACSKKPIRNSNYCQFHQAFARTLNEEEQRSLREMVHGKHWLEERTWQ